MIAAGQPLFVNAATNNFYLAANSLAIDSSLGSLQDRDDFMTRVKDPLGIAPSPKLGELMKLLKDAVEGGDLDAQREPDYYLDWLVQSGHASSP